MQGGNAQVVIGVRAVLAGGALLARAGARAVTAAAAHYCVPVSMLTQTHTHSCYHLDINIRSF
jgi:translation initiation factor 2B subunit (eIF-2B alpha/beta/delta family)